MYPLVQYADVPFVLIDSAQLDFDVSHKPILGADIIATARARGVRHMDLAGSTCKKAFSIAIRDEVFHHYFHFLETMLVIYAVQQEFFTGWRIEQIIVGLSDWNNPRQANVQREMLSILFPSVTVRDGKLMESMLIEKLLYIDRRLARTTINKMIESALPLVVKWAPKFRNAIYHAFNIPETSGPSAERWQSRVPRILYVTRRPPRSLAKTSENALLGALQKCGDLDIIDFQGLTWEAQVSMSSMHDLMVGVHGNGLSNLLWLPTHAAVIELFPANVHHYDYQLFAEVMNLKYFGLEGNNVFREFSRSPPPYGHNELASVPVTDINLENLAIALQNCICNGY